MPKIVSLTIAHYGSDYIAYALRAVAPFVDEVYVLYTDTPSHGTPTNLVCPDSPEQMRAAILGAGIGDKLRLIEGRWSSEGAHRDEIYKYVAAGDLIVVADADEIWKSENLQACIQNMNDWPEVPVLKVRMTNLWRSFNWCCIDPMTQDRIIRVGGDPMNWASIWSPTSQLPNNPDIWHLGYARKPEDIWYKMQIHGHVAEIYPEWYLEKFMKWTPENNIQDCHPACRDFWFPKPFDKNLLPEDLRLHPYWDCDIIM